MGHYLKKRTVAAIIKLKNEGCSNRRIARELDINRATVVRHLRMEEDSSCGEQVNRLKKVGEQTTSGPPSKCSAFQSQILSMVRQEHTAKQIHAELSLREKFEGSYYSVNRLVRRLKSSLPIRELPNLSLGWRKLNEADWMLEVLEGQKSSAILREDLGNESDLDFLLSRIKKGGLKNRDKAITILARRKGISNAAIAKFLHLGRETTRRYYDVYHANGPGQLFGPRKTKVCKSSDTACVDAVMSTFHSPPSVFGINRTTWKQADLRQVLAQKGILICERNIRAIFKKAGYRWRKAKKVLTSRAADYREKLDRIKSILGSIEPDSRFFSIDEFGPFYITKKAGRRLIAPGEEHTVPQWQKSRGRLIVTAALELCTNQVSHFFSDRKNTDEMLRLLDVLLAQYRGMRVIYLSWDAASWHVSKKFHKRVETHNQERGEGSPYPKVELAPLPAGSQFLNVIESVFSGMSRAIIHNSDYQSEEAAKHAIDMYLSERNAKFKLNPKRAGDKIWGAERVWPVFSESNNCKDPRWQ